MTYRPSSLALWLVLAAGCSSADSVGESTTPANDADVPGDGDAGDDAGSEAAPADAAPDAAKPDAKPPADGGVQSGNWTPEGASVLATLGASVAGLWPDPAKPRHFLVQLFGMNLLVEWTGGAIAMPLIAPPNGPPTLTFAGAGFDGMGGLYAYYGGFPGGPSSTPFKLATASAGGSWQWRDLPAPFNYPVWPPRSLAVGGGGSKGRAILFSDQAIWDVTGKLDLGQTLQWPNWRSDQITPSSEGGFGALAFVPGDPTTILVTMTSAPVVHTCTFGAALSCAPAATTGIVAGDTLTGIGIAASAHARVYAVGNDSQTRRLYTSNDGGATFATVPLPTSPVAFEKWAFSTAEPDTIVLYYPAYETEDGGSGADQLLFTKNAGHTWTALGLPTTPTTDVDAVTFDAAGTLFVVRGSTFFSQTL